MSVLLDERPHADAIKAAVKAQLGPNDVYDYGRVPGADGNPGVLPDIFVLLAIERTYNPNLRAVGKASATGWRISVRSVGRTVDETRWALAKVSAALNESRLTIDGSLTSPLQFESGQPATRDEGRYSGLSTFTYTHGGNPNA